MKNLVVLLISFLVLAVGISFGYYLGTSADVPKDFNWQVVSIDPSGRGYGYTTEAIFGSDIALPDIKKISGKTKFLSPINNGKSKIILGYLVTVDVGKLNLENVPEKYKKKQKKQDKGISFEVDPIDEVVYEITFNFTLKDKDGFDLINVESPKHFLSSGKENHFQDKIKQSISREAAHRTKNTILSMTIVKCETCAK